MFLVSIWARFNPNVKSSVYNVYNIYVYIHIQFLVAFIMRLLFNPPLTPAESPGPNNSPSNFHVSFVGVYDSLRLLARAWVGLFRALSTWSEPILLKKNDYPFPIDHEQPSAPQGAEGRWEPLSVP